MTMVKGIILGFSSFLLFVILLILGPVLTVHETVLNPQFITDEMDKISITPLFTELFSENIPAEYQTYSEQINQTIIDLEPWIKEQARNVVFSVYDYLSGEKDYFDVQISLDYVKQSLVKNLTMAYIQNPPPGTQQLSQNEVQQKISKDLQIDGTLQISSKNIGRDIMNLLENIRHIYSYVNLSFILLIVLGVLFIILIAAVIRDSRKITLSLGIILLIDGILTLVLYFALNSILTSILSSGDLPEAIHQMATIFSGDLLKIFWLYGLIILIVGFALFTTSLVLKRILYRHNHTVGAS
ncbi:MAG: hypothetical protein NUV31_04660 [Dehalococcoidales bacterium]|jgi:membrane-associated HD superfamily phosphohydrolase|nr:hypothetical protein [Dehalococcoidales bacterium]